MCWMADGAGGSSDEDDYGPPQPRCWLNRTELVPAIRSKIIQHMNVLHICKLRRVDPTWTKAVDSEGDHNKNSYLETQPSAMILIQHLSAFLRNMEIFI